MATGISTIKSNAKSSLKNKWVVSIVSAMTILFSGLIIENIAWGLSTVFGNAVAYMLLIIFWITFLGPLILGVIRHFWRMNGGLEETPMVSFYYFSTLLNYKKALRLCFKLALRFFITLLIFNLPAIVISIISSLWFYELLNMPIPMWSQNLILLVGFLSTIGTVLTVFSVVRFYLAPVLVIANDEIDVDEAIHMSSVISKSSLTDLIFLSLSMIHWILISLFFYAPLIFTLPYFLMCYVVHSSEAICAYNEKIKKLNDEYFPSFVAGA